MIETVTKEGISMRVFIKDKGEFARLEFSYPWSTNNWSEAIVSIEDGLGNGDFKWDKVQGCYACTQDIYEWWCETLKWKEDQEANMYKLRRVHGWRRVEACLEGVERSVIRERLRLIDKALNDGLEGDN